MIRQLEKEFTRKGYTYTQLYRDEKVVVYKVHDKDEVYYEIFKLNIVEVKDTIQYKTMREKGYTHYEKYPSDESFGSWAWCCRNLSSIERIYNLHFKDNDEIP